MCTVIVGGGKEERGEREEKWRAGEERTGHKRGEERGLTSSPSMGLPRASDRPGKLDICPCHTPKLKYSAVQQGH